MIRSLAGLVHGLILSGSFEMGYVAFNQHDKMEKVAVEHARWLTKFHGVGAMVEYPERRPS